MTDKEFSRNYCFYESKKDGKFIIKENNVNKIEGDLWLRARDLKFLENVPHIIEGDLRLEYNKISSLDVFEDFQIGGGIHLNGNPIILHNYYVTQKDLDVYFKLKDILNQ